MMRDLINQRKSAAITPPSTGEITQLAAILLIVVQLTALKPAAAIPAPITPPTTECVVDTGAPTQVARLTHKAADKRAAIIAQIKTSADCIVVGAIMPFAIVETTSPPAMIAPALSKTAAIAIAPAMVNAFAPTAGPILFATSFAPMLSAM